MIHTAILAASLAADPVLIDATDAIGLGADTIDQQVARLAFADLNGNGWPDLVIDRQRVFLNEPDEHATHGRVFREIPHDQTGLDELDNRASVVFADLNNSGYPDALVAEFIDRHNPDWTDHGRRTGWHEGRGDGTFGPRVPLDTPPRPTISIAVGDVNRNGTLDIYLGNTYRLYGGGWEGDPNDLLLSDGEGNWHRHPLPEDGQDFDPETDPGGRPTFGTMILNNPVGDGPMLLELSYGRRWNRAWVKDDEGRWHDAAPELGLDGDEIRHGRHPEWLKERAKEDPRFDRPDERPFRANGNTFDAAIGDVNANGRFDILISEITHGWAGDSSDRTRLLFNTPGENTGSKPFVERPQWNLDRVPPAPDDPAEPHNWNQGDLFCELADLTNDGRLDIIISSGDYPDDQRLRFFRNTPEGATLAEDHWGVDHDGSQQISLADVTGNGALDLAAGQTFRRFRPDQREGRTPRPRLFLNQADRLPPSVTIRLRGNGRDTNRSAIGAEAEASIGDRRLLRQLVGPGGHAGKQHDLILHFGLDQGEQIDELAVRWPNAAGERQTLRDIPPGRYVLTQGGDLRPAEAGGSDREP